MVFIAVCPASQVLHQGEHGVSTGQPGDRVHEEGHQAARRGDTPGRDLPAPEHPRRARQELRAYGPPPQSCINTPIYPNTRIYPNIPQYPQYTPIYPNTPIPMPQYPNTSSAPTLWSFWPHLVWTCTGTDPPPPLLYSHLTFLAFSKLGLRVLIGACNSILCSLPPLGTLIKQHQERLQGTLARAVSSRPVPPCSRPRLSPEMP